MSWQVITNVLGGLGLFLLGMHLMTEGLKLASGQALRNILERSTATPLRGVFSGLFITSLVQSSGAVTVATIGFVNAGLMTLKQSITVIYGSNIGTTTTGWLVAVIGFNFDIKAFALPLIGLGMGMRIIANNQRLGALGEALAGFGVFFIGIDILRTGFVGLGADYAVQSWHGDNLAGLALLVGTGILFTMLMQSSSASMAVILTAAAGGVITLEAAAAMVIGANVGSTSTAVLAVLGATPNAKRVAAAHVAFNLITGAVALLLLPLLLWSLGVLRAALQLDGEPVALLALFHTAFNVLGVILMWPLTTRLASWLERRLRVAEEDEARPKYLDRNVVNTPVLALHALAQELARIGAISRRMAKGAISTELAPGQRLAGDKAIVDKLTNASVDFSATLQRTSLPADLADALPNAPRVARYYTEVAETALTLADLEARAHRIEEAALAEHLAQFKVATIKLLDAANIDDEHFSTDACRHQLKALEQDYQRLKGELLRAGTQGLLPTRHMVEQLDILSDMRRMYQQAEKGGRYLTTLSTYASAQRPSAAEAAASNNEP